ncbi:hypothetical protein ACIBCB_34525 [Streptomyces uncialis]|uniref:hypothetical protein n=1 Tax=Streptomyces uncialis TaxID=1048205 RepID=UPI00379E3519
MTTSRPSPTTSHPSPTPSLPPDSRAPDPVPSGSSSPAPAPSRRSSPARTAAPAAAGEWETLPTFVVRTAGFPWRLVERLGYGAARRLAAELVELEERAAALARRAAPERRLPRALAARLRNRRPMPADAPFPREWLAGWNELTGRLARTRELFTAAVAEESAAVTGVLAGMTADERFLEAVVCSSPPAYRELRKGAKGARLRRQSASYAQRFAAKCETMSFFGPINYGRLDPALGAVARWSWEGHERVPWRTAFTAARVVDRIQEAVLADPAVVAALVPDRKSWLAPTGTAPGASVRARLVGAADGVRDVAALARALDLEPPVAVEAFRDAVARGLLTHSFAPPATVADPVGWLAGRLAREPDALSPALRALVAGVREVLARYPDAAPDHKVELQSRLVELARDAVPGDGPGADPGRDERAIAERGRFYNDRVIVHEAAAGTLDLRLGGGLARDLRERVAPVLDLLAEDAELTRALAGRQVAGRLGPGRFPLLTAMRRCEGLAFERSEGLPSRLLDILTGMSADTAEVDLADLLERPAPAGPPVLCSVDVMIDTAGLDDYVPGRTPLVLGDIHDAALLTPWALQFHPDGAALRAGRDAAIRRVLGDQDMVSVIARRTTGLPPLEFPGLVLELGGTSERDDAPRIGLDRLYVDSDGERVTLRATGHDRPLMLHNGELDTAFHTALALPRIRRPRLPDLPHVPRLIWGNAVLSRRRWTVPSEAVATLGKATGDAERLLAAARLCAAHGLPDTFFAKSANERKPVYVDTASPALLDCLVRLATTDERLVLGETLPGPGRSWLRDGDERIAAELRCVYLRGAV